MADFKAHCTIISTFRSSICIKFRPCHLRNQIQVPVDVEIINFAMDEGDQVGAHIFDGFRPGIATVKVETQNVTNQALLPDSTVDRIQRVQSTMYVYFRY